VTKHARSTSRSTRVATAAVAGAALLLSGCSSSPAPDSSATPSGGDAVAQATAVAALSPEEREAQLRTLSADLERQLVTLSGLEKELGGPEKATAAYTAMTAAMVTQVRRRTAAPSFVGRFGGLAPRADTPSLGGMIFAGWIASQLGTEGIVSATNDFKAGEQPVHDVSTDASGTITRDGSVATAGMDFNIETTANGVTGKMKVKIDVKPCPDATGTFTAHITISASATSSAGRVGSNTTTDVTITGHVDDNAKLAGYDTAANTQAAEFGGGGNKWAEYTATTSWSGSRVTAATRTFGRTSGAVTPKFQQDWAQMGTLTEFMVTNTALEAAQKAWESGRCVALVPTTSPDKRSGLDPSAAVTITAAPRSKIDGGQVGGTVTATLSGQTSIDPAGSKVPADATFHYVAPGEKDKSASVALEARSKRGVAKASVDLDTKSGSYEVTGTMASAPSGTTFTGTICGPAKPFTVQTTGDMVGTASFVPKSATNGSVTFKGKVGNAPLAMVGNGSYTLTPPAGSGTGTLAITWKLTIQIPYVGDQTRSGPATLTLTPAARC